MAIAAKIENRQKKFHPNPRRCQRLLEWLIAKARSSLPRDARPWSAVTVVFVNDKLSEAAHKTVFSAAGATDVITLAYAALPGFADGDSGELLINVERAVKEGSRKHGRLGWSPSHELALYMAHGLDHFAGRDDLDPRGRRTMRLREMRWVRAAECRRLLDKIFRAAHASRPDESRSSTSPASPIAPEAAQPLH